MKKPLNFLVAPDKFRGSLSAAQASHAIKMGISSAIPNATITEFSLTDGGDSFVDTVAKVKKGAKTAVKASGDVANFTKNKMLLADPPGQTLTAKCALLDDETALVGLTEASGINLISESDRNPATLTNIGSGNILAKLVERGYKTIIVGVGGSATNDGGIGLLIPLGFKFLDEKGQPIEPNGRGLAKLAEIVPPEKPIPARFIAATDVDIPLLGTTPLYIRNSKI